MSAEAEAEEDGDLDYAGSRKGMETHGDRSHRAQRTMLLTLQRCPGLL